MMWYDHIYRSSNAYLCWGAGARCGALPDSDNRHAGSSSGSCSRRLTRLLRPSNIAVDYRPKLECRANERPYVFASICMAPDLGGHGFCTNLHNMCWA